MDAILCDELLQEIFHLLPPPCYATVSLVCKRWLRLLRSSTSSLTLYFSPPSYNSTTINSLSSFLCQHPYLFSLSLTTPTDSTSAADCVFLCAASSCPNLRQLRFLSTPVSPFSLFTLSNSCHHLSSLTIDLYRPLSFRWLTFFNFLKHLSIFLTNPSTKINSLEINEMDRILDVELGLESLALSGIRPGDYGLNFLWRNCKNIKKLQLRSCESLGDYASFSGFVMCSKDLREIELRSCRSIVDGVLQKMAESCVCLDFLLVYDGGSREGLHQFISQSKCKLGKLDFRLPLDLNNSHLIAITENLNFRSLVSLRLESSCLVTGEGLKALGRVMGNGLEELALINCDVVERESGLLTTLGQDFKRLRKLDLSYNEMLLDRELISMLVSCNCLSELKLRGCNRLTNLSLASMVRSCKLLQSVDIMCCCGVEVEAVELLVLNSPQLRKVEVEQNKISNVARTWLSNKSIEFVA
ncbi:RNI-like superfamily protein [Forsythia ovata]|uniref:RNI-like superfamily protein n=1 Tax=Forsythia ovata TaxID=205694 RepID=A0ABD1UE80_9LAMI